MKGTKLLGHRGTADLRHTIRERLSVAVRLAPGEALPVIDYPMHALDGRPLELVENVEDTQVTYGRDTNGDRTADVYEDATSVGANWGQVVAARINLLISSPDTNVTTSPQTYNFNGYAVTAGTGDRSM